MLTEINFDGIIGPDIFYTASIYSLSIIPLYLVMAQLLLRGGVIVDLFRVAHRLSGYKRFPLGVATILTGGLLGAVCGSGSASAAALATLALATLLHTTIERPAMQRIRDAWRASRMQALSPR